jgi:hypothetical protein
MSTSNHNSDAGSRKQKVDTTPIPLLRDIQTHGRVWGELAVRYGVTNPDPPWKVTLEATCDLLAEDACALPALERRDEEDDLSETVYADVPFPERQLLALAHSLIRRGLLDEQELAGRMKLVGQRLNAA